MTGRPLKQIEDLFHLSKFVFSDLEKENIILVIKKHSRRGKGNVRRITKHIAKLKENNVSFVDLPERIENILLLGKDSSSLKSLILRYGEEKGNTLFLEKNEKCKFDKIKLENKIGKENVTKILEQRGASIENYIKRHGEKEGTIKWQQYLEKRANTYKKKHKEGYQFFNPQSLENYVKRHGVEEGKKLYNETIEKQKYRNSKQRYIDEYGYKEGSKICREIKDTLSKKSFIKRYGYIDGLIEYEKYHANKAKNITYSFYSKSSERFFITLAEYLGLEDCLFGKNEKIFYLTKNERLILPQRIVAVDFTLKNKVIEYNGDTIHANPKMFKENDNPHPWKKNLLASYIWEHDRKRHDIIHERGFEILVIWESDVIKNLNETLNICEKFLLENR